MMSCINVAVNVKFIKKKKFQNVLAFKDVFYRYHYVRDFIYSDYMTIIYIAYSKITYFFL